MKTLVPILALILVGCASTEQSQNPSPGALNLTLDGTPNGVTVIVLNAQVALVARPVGLDILNPGISAAPNVNSPNSAAQSGTVDMGKPDPKE